MLPDGAIRASHVWKRFRADRRRKLLRDEVEHLWKRASGNGQGGWRWALRDVEFEAEPGGSVALVGANGSGKTTLLKLLTRVMYPYAGTIDISGRVGALIEIQAGIHPDLSGRENVFVTGSLLGLGRRRVVELFDEIVAFAELEDAIDRQVKFYSSGMSMRLGFAIASFLEPDILLVDEALAVGDAGFQQKCLDRMRHVLTGGTTLVFVSHDLASVEATCEKALWMDVGQVKAAGDVADVLSSYRGSIEQQAESRAHVAGLVRLLKTEVSSNGQSDPRSEEPLDVRLVFESTEPRIGKVCLGISQGPSTPIFMVRRDLSLAEGETEASCRISSLPLPRGRFYVWISVIEGRGRDLLPWHPAAHFDVLGPELDPTPAAIKRLAPVHVSAAWSFN
jgi:ABC-type polysaccharide/polyol phosphate transport system ATPase subunit